MDTTLSTDSFQKEALVVDGAEFEWVGLPEETEEEKTKKDKKKFSSLEAQDFVASDPFRIRDLSLSIEKGSLVAICGPVGSGSESVRRLSSSPFVLTLLPPPRFLQSQVFFKVSSER